MTILVPEITKPGQDRLDWIGLDKSQHQKVKQKLNSLLCW